MDRKQAAEDKRVKRENALTGRRRKQRYVAQLAKDK